MAAGTHSDEIFQTIISELTPPGQVMNLQAIRGTTILAAPPVPFEHLFT